MSFRRYRFWGIAALLAATLVGCGDDGGTGSIDASSNPTVDSGQATIDAPLNGVDAAPQIDATPLPPDASTAGRACSFPDSMAMAVSNMSASGLVCFDPDTGNNCRVITPGQFSCFNDQVGFYFGWHDSGTMVQRSIAGRDGLTITAAGGGTGTLSGAAVIGIADGASGTVTGQSPTGQSFTLSYQYNGTTVSLPSLTGP